MNELQIEITKQGEIVTNLDALKAELTEIAVRHKGVIVTEENLPLAKKDLAELRKVSKEIEDERKAIKKEWNKPYAAFEAEVKKALEIINEPIEEIDKQIKEFANQEKSLKEMRCREIYAQEVTDKGYEDYLPFASIFNEKWLNKSTSDNDIIFDMNGAVTKIKMDLDAIKALQSEFEDEIIEAYKVSGNQLTAAIQRNQQLMSAKQIAEQKVKEEVKQEVKEEEAEINPLPFDVETVRFIVHGESDITKVREFLNFSEIEYEEETVVGVKVIKG